MTIQCPLSDKKYPQCYKYKGDITHYSLYLPMKFEKKKKKRTQNMDWTGPILVYENCIYFKFLKLFYKLM